MSVLICSRKTIRFLTTVLVLSTVVGLSLPVAQGDASQVKNLIVMIPDGCSNSIQTLARWMKGDDLTLDGMLVGAVKTYAANSVITGSASAVTAFSTGHKTTVGFLGIGPRPDGILSSFDSFDEDLYYRPLATVLEGARLMGKATGLVATSRVSHATPAGYGAHVPSREKHNEIMEQLIYQDITVVLGGGSRYLFPQKMGGRRTDGENLLAVLKKKNYQFVETNSEMQSVTQGKLWGLFQGGSMHPDIDRQYFAPHEPTLAEMTSKAIELLSQDDDGFFLMVEGSQVDWAGHANDPIYMVTDFLAFDEAVAVATDFAQRDGQTLVLAFPDHNCGGLSIGSEHASIPYGSTSVEHLIRPLKAMKMTSSGLADKIGSDLSPQNVRSNISQWWGLELTNSELERIITAITDRHISLERALTDIVCRSHTVLGWTTHGHTGDDVPLWAYGPDRPLGLVDNTDLAYLCARVLGFSLEEIGARLFVDATQVFPADLVNIDRTDRDNPVVSIGAARLPVNKNILRLGGQTHQLEGLIVYIPKTDKVYLPREAIALIESKKD